MTTESTVQASDGNQTGYFKVTVNVTDREETGKVTWSVTPTGVKRPSLGCVGSSLERR